MMLSLVQQKNWSTTPLGPRENWPPSLRFAVQTLLHSRFPMFLWWGPDLINIYNDTYAPVLGKRHPDALGQPASAIWKEIWPSIGPEVERVMATGEATWHHRSALLIERNGYSEEAFFTWSHSPLFDEQGAVAGILCVCTEETPRVRLEAERDQRFSRVRTEHDRLAEAFAQSPAFLALLQGPNHRFEFVNDRYQQLLGNRPLVGRTVGEAVPEVKDQGYLEILDRVYSTGEPFIGTDMRLQLQREEGQPLEQVCLEFVYQPMRNAAGEVTGILVHGVDVTARRQAEQALRASEAAFRQLADAMPQIVFSATPEGHVDYFNRQWYEYTGLPQGSVGYDAWKQVHTKEGLQRAMQAWPQAVRSGEPYEIEYPLRRHDGEYRWHLGRALPIKDAEGKILRWYGTNTDIHDRRMAEAALRKSDERLRLAQRAGRVGVFEWNVATGYVYRSPELEALYDADPGSLSGQRDNWHKHVLPEDSARVDAEMAEAIRRNQPKFTFEFRVRTRDGNLRWLAGMADISYDDRGNAVRIIGVNLDISERKANEAARERLLAAERAARAEAERASEAKSDFLATLSHELRTPLTPVLLTASLFETHPHLPEDLRDGVATIRRNVELEARLISDLLDLTRITRGKLQLDSQDLDLHRVLRAAVDICRRDTSARLAVHLDAPRHTVHGDATRLQQIFWNLITNAQKFTPPEGCITIRTSNVGEKVRIDVTDTGMGIDPAVLPKLFNAFEQGHARSLRQHAGLGLGLAISRRLAEAHGGAVTATSPGRGLGATFTVELPLVRTSAAALPLSAPSPATAPSRAHSILLVEDHEATLHILAKLLGKMGHRVTKAASMEEAIAQARRGTFDLLISDIGLPDGSGLDLIQNLPQFSNRSIALTGYGMETDIAASGAAGFARHITKPVDLPHLQAAIVSILER